MYSLKCTPELVIISAVALLSCFDQMTESCLWQSVSCLPSAAVLSSQLQGFTRSDGIPTLKQSCCRAQVQWNACYAVGSLLKNVAAASNAAQRERLEPLLSALLALVKSSPNYKAS